MIKNRTIHIPFAALPAEARVLFSIYASAALARYSVQPPKQSELTPALEIVWNWNLLCQEDLSDPYGMTELLIEHFALHRMSEDDRGAQ